MMREYIIVLASALALVASAYGLAVLMFAHAASL